MMESREDRIKSRLLFHCGSHLPSFTEEEAPSSHPLASLLANSASTDYSPKAHIQAPPQQPTPAATPHPGSSTKTNTRVDPLLKPSSLQPSPCPPALGSHPDPLSHGLPVPSSTSPDSTRHPLVQVLTDPSAPLGSSPHLPKTPNPDSSQPPTFPGRTWQVRCPRTKRHRLCTDNTTDASQHLQLHSPPSASALHFLLS